MVKLSYKGTGLLWVSRVCRKGYENAAKRFVEKDMDVSVAGRSFMITGANSGIGKATAIAIAKRGGWWSGRGGGGGLVLSDIYGHNSLLTIH